MAIDVLIVAIASILTSAGACIASTITALHVRKIKYMCCDVELSPTPSERSHGRDVNVNINTTSAPPPPVP